MTLDADRKIRLGELAHARSGDKGDRSNIGVVALDAAAYAWLRIHLDEAAVLGYFKGLGVASVRRYELPNLLAFNFILDRALGGGAARSLRFDSQGKALGVALLELEVDAPPGFHHETPI